MTSKVTTGLCAALAVLAAARPAWSEEQDRHTKVRIAMGPAYMVFGPLPATGGTGSFDAALGPHAWLTLGGLYGRTPAGLSVGRFGVGAAWRWQGERLSAGLGPELAVLWYTRATVDRSESSAYLGIQALVGYDVWKRGSTAVMLAAELHAGDMSGGYSWAPALTAGARF